MMSRARKAGRSVALLAFLVAGRTSTVSGQTIVGRAVDSISGLAIAGAVLQQVDRAGRIIRQTVSDGTGLFRLPQDTAAQTLRVLRIGYSPRVVALAQFARAEPWHLALRRVPTLLDRVDAVANLRCPRTDQAADAWALWRHTQLALLASVVARQVDPAVTRLLLYQRILSPRSDSIQEQRIHHELASGAFRAAFSAADFAATGFLAVRPDGDHTYYGPDADVLLDDAFASSYCVSIDLQAVPRPGLVGLRFSPAHRRSHRVDVDGIVWVDTTRRVVQEIQFTYLGLDPNSRRYRPGGIIRFRHADNGVSFVDSWSLRMVSSRLDNRCVIRTIGGRLARWRRNDSLPPPLRYCVTEGGGQVVEAQWKDGAMWRASLASLRIHVVDGRGKQARRILLSIDSSDFRSVVDSAGNLTVSGLISGPYTAVLVDSLLPKLGLRRGTRLRFTVDSDSLMATTVAVRTLDDLIDLSCSSADGAATHQLVARVLSTAGTPIEGARWILGNRGGVSNADGLFAYCGSMEGSLDLRVYAPAESKFLNQSREITLRGPMTLLTITLPSR
jgi:hypothetical protein